MASFFPDLLLHLLRRHYLPPSMFFILHSFTLLFCSFSLPTIFLYLLFFFSFVCFSFFSFSRFFSYILFPFPFLISLIFLSIFLYFILKRIRKEINFLFLFDDVKMLFSRSYSFVFISFILFLFVVFLSSHFL